MRKDNATNRIPDIEPYVSQRPEKIQVHQYGLNGKYIQTFESIFKASKLTKTNCSGISACINGEAKSAGGFQWKKA